MTLICPDNVIKFLDSCHLTFISPPRVLTCFANISASPTPSFCAQYGANKQLAEPHAGSSRSLMAGANIRARKVASGSEDVGAEVIMLMRYLVSSCEGSYEADSWDSDYNLPEYHVGSHSLQGHSPRQSPPVGTLRTAQALLQHTGR